MALTSAVGVGFVLMRRLLRVGAKRESMADMGFVVGRNGKSRICAFREVKSVGEPSVFTPYATPSISGNAKTSSAVEVEEGEGRRDRYWETTYRHGDAGSM